MIEGLDHIAVAVADLEAAVARYRDLWGFKETGRGIVETEGVEEATLEAKGLRVQLIAPLHDTSALARFVAERGEGLHHVAFAVPDLDAAIEAMKAAGVEPIAPAPRPGAGGTRIAFIHPRDAMGVLVEMVERGGNDAADGPKGIDSNG